MEASQRPHSEAYFGDYRDHWWNLDFLQLMARRWELSNVQTVLDVGCGIGHWSRCLEQVLPSDAILTGVDREAEWINRARTEKPSTRLSFRQADAYALPFEDNSFDLVTCQTLLIHLDDPRRAIHEMKRVTKPGGLILAVEPNNRSGTLITNSLSPTMSIDETLDGVRLFVTIERGITALQLGDISCGDKVPGWMVEAGLREISVYLSDKTLPLFPPYESREQRALVAQYQREESSTTWAGWSQAEASTYFLAGGGSEPEFERLWQVATANPNAFKKALRDQTYHSAGGAMMYLVAGRV